MRISIQAPISFVFLLFSLEQGWARDGVEYRGGVEQPKRQVVSIAGHEGELEDFAKRNRETIGRAKAGHLDDQGRLLVLIAEAERAGVPAGHILRTDRNLFKAFEKNRKVQSPDGRYRLGVLYLRGWGVNQDLNAAKDQFRQAAEKGHPRAMYYLGYLYSRGIGGLLGYGVSGQSGWPKAAEWFQRIIREVKADAKVVQDASNDLGLLYFYGIGVKLDMAEAKRLFLSAAEQGHVLAMINAATIYEKMSPPDYQAALRWYKAAAETGNLDALSALVDIYSKGRGDPRSLGIAKDSHLAEAWAAKAELKKQGKMASDPAVQEIDAVLASANQNPNYPGPSLEGQRCSALAGKKLAQSELQPGSQSFQALGAEIAAIVGNSEAPCPIEAQSNSEGDRRNPEARQKRPTAKSEEENSRERGKAKSAR